MRNSETPPGADEPDLLFFDDFASGNLDRTKWNVRTTGPVVNNEQQAYVDSPETLYVCPEVPGSGNNVLVLETRFRPDFQTADGQRFDFVSSRIDTRERFQFTYGSAAARIKLPAGPGLWPAFWLMGLGSWPGTGEIDVMENVGEPDWVSSAIHGPGYSGEAGLVNKYYFPDENDATAWHTYSVDWAFDRLVFKVDSHTVYRVEKPMVDFFGSWMFDNEKFLILNLAVGGVYPFKTSGLQTPYHGVGEETVAAIKGNRAKVMIDWVRVSGRADHRDW